jgi:hypothetical protein
MQIKRGAAVMRYAPQIRFDRFRRAFGRTKWKQDRCNSCGLRLAVPQLLALRRIAMSGTALLPFSIQEMSVKSTPMISTAPLDRLIQLGRRRGGLEIDDIRQVLPVDTMTTEELADVLARLEEAGISVEIDRALLTPRRQKISLPEGGPATVPSRHSDRATTADARLSGLALSIKAGRENSYRPREPARTSVKISGTIFVVVAALVLFLFALAVCRFA